MANAIKVHRPQRFTELLDLIEAFQSRSAVSWSRGCRNSKHSLIPSLYRHKRKLQAEELIALENEIITRFVQRSLPFISRTLVDEWDELFFMQHYGVPTRLLDWTENPFVAIYFALLSSEEPKNTNAAIWMCDPIAWNRAALEHISFKGEVLDQSNTILRPYSPGTNVKEIPMLPIMIYGSYNSPRIVAQRGGFALFGQGAKSMDELYETPKFADGSLEKIEIEHDKVDDLKLSLFRKGFTESVVFPDLDGLAKEIRRIFGF